MILSSGYRIGPFEVESALVSHPAVAEAAAVAAPDPERGAVVRAIVVLRDREPSEELARELQEHVQARDRPLQVPPHRRVRERAAEDEQRQDQAGRAAADGRRASGKRSAGASPECLVEAHDARCQASALERDRPQADRRADRGQQEQFRKRTGASAKTFERAVKVMPNGVPSSFQENDPWPVYIERGKGSRVWDVDGNEYVDFHNGFGVMCIGHANPTVGAAVKARIDGGHPLRRPHRRLDRGRRGAARGASACPSGASPTPAPSRRWTPSTSPAAPPAAT